MTRNLSDYNSADQIAQPVSAGVYRDVSSRFIHPITKKVIVSTDLDAIRNSVKNIILTERGTRPFNPTFGTQLTALLFEPVDAFTARSIEFEITDSLKKWEPRVTNVVTRVSDDSDNNAYNVRIGFTAQYDTRGEINFTLNRIR